MSARKVECTTVWVLLEERCRNPEETVTTVEGVYWSEAECRSAAESAKNDADERSEWREYRGYEQTIYGAKP